MKAKRISAAIAAIAMAVSLTAPMSASADTVYTTIEGTKVTSFDKYLVMPKDATIPSAGFSFSIQAGEAVDAEADGTTQKRFYCELKDQEGHFIARVYKDDPIAMGALIKLLVLDVFAD